MKIGSFITFGAVGLVLGGLCSGSNLEESASVAWSENTGHLAGFQDHGLVVRRTSLSGSLWGENIGWVFCGEGPVNRSSYVSSSGEVGVNRSQTTGELSGYAWSENTGWINFSWWTFDTEVEHRPVMDDNGAFSGFAWGENIGWVSLAGMVRAPDFDWDGLSDDDDPDDDNDRLPDIVEIERNLDPRDDADGRIDSDNDGIDDGTEYLAGTDPTSASSRFGASLDSATTGKPEIRFSAPAGRRFQVLVSDHPGGPFVPFGEVFSGTDGMITQELPDDIDVAFYKVVVKPEQ